MAQVNRIPQRQGVFAWLNTSQMRIASLYDRIATTHNKEIAERLAVYLAAGGFLLHLALIFFAQTLPALAPLVRLTGPNYLAAIYTPFAMILFYEVLLLVFAIPESTTRSIGLQFEIISLIAIRNVFKDFVQFESFNAIEQQLETFGLIVIDMFGGLLLFLLVTIFYRINSRRSAQEQAMTVPTHELEQFIARKKIIALVLSVCFFVLLGVSLWTWAVDSYHTVVTGTRAEQTLTTIFYADFFTLIIFTDVLLLVLSLLLSDRYQLVFRNAGFVIATILLRVSLTADRPYNLITAIVATIFGILVLWIYKSCSHVEGVSEVQRFSDH
ncbi:MAG: hypothetical protein MI924_05275 [Chloroflexales bacterium]|nr:hypothetical protein [Chloroflexales bacterium]